MRIDLKNTRIAARRVLQGGATFAALGALSIATALPAAADTEYYGWAYAAVGNGQGVSASYADTSSTSYSGSVGSWLSFSGTSSATVNGDGVTATATVDTARVQITVGDVEKIVEEKLVEENLAESLEEDAEAADEETAGEESDDTDGDAEAVEEPDGEESDGTDGDAEGGETEAPSEPEATEPVESTEPTEQAESETLVLDEEDTELSSGSDEIVLDATLSGVTTTTTQNWDGEVTHSSDYNVSTPDVVTLNVGQEITVWVDIQSYQGEDEYYDDEYGVNWNDAYTGFAVTFTVDGAEAPFYYVDLAESVASVGTVEVGGDDGGDDGGKGDDDKDDKGGDEGEDKNPPKRDTEKLPQPEPKETESLARTGSPIAGLIAAGAAIAAGGGAAAYFARRKKNAVESTTENSES